MASSEKTLRTVCQDTADAIREKTGKTDKIKPINFADEIKSISGEKNAITAFLDQTITSVDDDQVKAIGDSRFLLCEKLASVNLPNVAYLGYGVFQYCKSLTKLVFPKVTKIANAVFTHCTNLEYIEFGSLTQILYALHFNNDTKLTTFIIRTTSQVCTLANTNTFDNTPIATSTTEGFIYVPDDLVESYKSATNWSTYASKIKGLSELPS